MFMRVLGSHEVGVKQGTLYNERDLVEAYMYLLGLTIMYMYMCVHVHTHDNMSATYGSETRRNFAKLFK